MNDPPGLVLRRQARKTMLAERDVTNQLLRLDRREWELPYPVMERARSIHHKFVSRVLRAHRRKRNACRCAFLDARPSVAFCSAASVRRHRELDQPTQRDGRSDDEQIQADGGE